MVKINEIIDETGVKLDIEQDGQIFIGAVDQEMINRAREIIEEITREAEVGQVYNAKVKRIEKYGAFVELFPEKMRYYTSHKFQLSVLIKLKMY